MAIEFGTTPAVAGDAVTVFGTRSGVEQKVGRDNLAHYADLNSNENAAEITAAIADDLTEAAADMAQAWREYLQSVRVPGEAVSDVALGSSNAIEARWLADTNEYGAAVKAWVGRTIDAAQGQDVPQQVGTAMDEWNKRLAMLRAGTALLAYQTAEGVIDESADEPGGFEAVEVVRTPECTDDEFAED